MEFLEQYIEPSYSRKPFYDGDAGQPYVFSCPKCQGTVQVPFSELLNSAWGWQENFSETEAQNIKAHFGIGVAGKSHDGGLPSINKVCCPNCNAQYLAYIGFNEYRNSVYKVTEQGLYSVKT